MPRFAAPGLPGTSVLKHDPESEPPTGFLPHPLAVQLLVWMEEWLAREERGEDATEALDRMRLLARQMLQQGSAEPIRKPGV